VSTRPPIQSCLTVGRALELPTLRRGLPLVVAGRARLDRPLRWVHAGEVAHMATLLRGGELLLTTGMGIAPDARGQRRFVEALAIRQVAALAVELGRDRTALPPALVAAAEESGLPLIELHREVPFVAITEEIHTALVNERYELLRRVDELGARLTQALLDGEGIAAVLRALASACGNPVYLQSDADRLLLHETPDGTGADDALDAWEHAADEADALGVTVALPGRGRLPQGRLTVLPTLGPLDPITAPALDHAASILGLAMVRSAQERMLLVQSRGQLLAALAADRLSPAVAAQRAGAAELTPDTPLLPFAAPPLPRSGGWHEQLETIERGCAALGLAAIAGVDDDGRLLALVGLRTGAERAATAERVAELVNAAATHGAGGETTTTTPAVAAVAAWSDAGERLRDAIDAADAASAGEDRPAGAWIDAERVRLERLVWQLRDAEPLRAFAERTLAPLIDHDAARSSQLLPTVAALCRHGGRKAAAARELHLNRHSLYDRLARAEQLLGVELDDPRVLLELQLALLVHRQTR
jgi:purine catabolism regulator